MSDEYRADVLGSMLRPQYMKDARAESDAGTLAPDEFKRIEDRAVDETIELQERTGVDVITDGEIRRFLFVGALTEVVEGITEQPSATFHWYGDDPGDEVEFENRLCVTGKLRRRRSLATEEFAYARARAVKPLKVTLPSPLMLVNFWHPEHSRDAYGDLFEAFADAASILREEVEDLIEMGCRYIQIDAPELGVMVDERQHDFYRSQGFTPERALTEGNELLNSLPVDRKGVTYGLHLCRGNNEGRWMAAGGYEPISKQLFQGASNYDRFLLEFDSPRAGALEAIADVPNDKVVVLGLVSTKHADLEPIEEMLARIDQAGKLFPRDQLAVSTQCGFASSSLGNPISIETEEAKLKLVAEIARRGWDA